MPRSARSSSSRFRPGWVALFTAVAVIAGSAATASADPPKPAPGAPAAPGPKPLAETLTGAAKGEYDAARVLYNDGDFNTAGTKYRAAYEKQPDPRLLWNIASCEKSLRHYTKAVALLHRYLAEGGDLLTADDKKDATYVLDVIERLTAPISIRVSEPGATVFLDDEKLGQSPLPDPITVDVGTRKVRVEKEGFRPFLVEQAIAPSQVIEVKLEHQRGRLELTVNPNATVFVDDKEIGRGPLVIADNLPVGPHTLKITAPRMRSYQGELVLEDDKQRKLQIILEQDPDLIGEVRVAVGCEDPHIKTPDQGLSVFLDHSLESASALGVRKRVLDDGREVPAYVPYIVYAGAHAVRVRFPNCEPLDINVEAGANKPTTVSGILPPTRPFLNGSPVGSPNGWEVHIGLATSAITLPRFDRLFGGTPPLNDVAADLTLVGLQLGGGVEGRWFTFSGELRYLAGSTSGSRPGVLAGTGQSGPIGPISLESSFNMKEIGFRMGPRFPFYYAALGFGVGATVGQFSASPTGSEDQSGVMGRGFGWAAIEGRYFCDWKLEGGVNYGVMGIDSDAANEPMADFGVFFHVGYSPNTVCARKRNGEYALKELR